MKTLLLALLFSLSCAAPQPPAAAVPANPAPVQTPAPQTAPVRKSSAPRYTRVDSLSQGSELALSRDKLLLEEAGTARPGDTSGGALRYKVAQGFRIQAYATTNFKDAEKKKEDLLAVLEEPVYVIYEEPFYKIRVGNFEREEEAKELKRKLADMGNDAWIVSSKVRVRGK